MLALFQATVEQQSTQIGKHKQQTKFIFNKWMKMGNKLLDQVHKEMVREDMMNQITDVILNATNKIRKDAKI